MAIQLIDKIRTIVWYESIAYAIDAKTAHEFATKFDELRHEAYLASNFPEPPSFDMKSFKAYERATSIPSEKTLQLVDDLLPRTAEIFRSGPRTSRHVLDGKKKKVLVTSTAPMWLALGGSAEACKAVLVWYDKELGSMLASHADVLTLAKQAIKWLPFNVLLELADQPPHSNAVAHVIKSAEIRLSVDDLTVLIALWRLSMATHQSFSVMNYTMNGLYPQVIPDIMSNFRENLGADVITYCKMCESTYLEYLARLKGGNLPDEFDPFLTAFK